MDARLPFSGRKRKSEKFLRSSSLSRPINTAPYVAFKYYDIAKPMTCLPATLFAAPGVANRQWLKSLGPELEKVVREESHKAEEVFGEWNINDIKSKEEVCTSDASKADWIASATKRTITEKMDEDPAFYRQRNCWKKRSAIIARSVFPRVITSKTWSIWQAGWRARITADKSLRASTAMKMRRPCSGSSSRLCVPRTPFT